MNTMYRLEYVLERITLVIVLTGWYSRKIPSNVLLFY